MRILAQVFDIYDAKRVKNLEDVREEFFIDLTF